MTTENLLPLSVPQKKYERYFIQQKKNYPRWKYRNVRSTKQLKTQENANEDYFIKEININMLWELKDT